MSGDIVHSKGPFDMVHGHTDRDLHVEDHSLNIFHSWGSYVDDLSTDTKGFNSKIHILIPRTRSKVKVTMWYHRKGVVFNYLACQI